MKPPVLVADADKRSVDDGDNISNEDIEEQRSEDEDNNEVTVKEQEAPEIG
jgi:hypothetical protein